MSNLTKQVASWCVHLITASGILVGLLAALAISENRLKEALYLMVVTIIIDAIDGPMARLLNIKKTVPQFDGYLLDNIVDFFTWVIVPVLFILKTNMLPPFTSALAAGAILLSSCYQFCCTDVKSCVSSFKRFPSAWSVVIILLYTWQTPPFAALMYIAAFVILSFIPLYYIHPFQKNTIFKHKVYKLILQVAAISLLVSMFIAIFIYPNQSYWLSLSQQVGMIIYFCVCFYHTKSFESQE